MSNYSNYDIITTDRVICIKGRDINNGNICSKAWRN